MRTTKGFSLVEVLIITGVVVLLGGLGYVGWKSFNKSHDTAATTGTSSSSEKSAKVITTKADLEAAEKSLKELDFDDTSAAAAEEQASL